MKPLDQCWSIAEAVGLATILEASAPKLGNVHPGASFSDMQFGHFIASATAISSVFAEVNRLTLGQLVLAAVQATRLRAGCNTNLGTILLLAPLAKAASKRIQFEPHFEATALPTGITRQDLQASVAEVLQELTPDDSQLVYEAIRTAQPGGLGQQSANDIAQPAPLRLIDAMQQVAEVDAVARQYVNNFADVFQRLLPWLDEALIRHKCTLKAIVHLQLRTLAWQPDGLIARKCGMNLARQVQSRAQEVLQIVDSGDETSHLQLDRLDKYLRTDGNRLNPGTTADMVAAAIFCRLVSACQSI